MLLPPNSSAVVVVAGMPGAGKTTLVAGDPRALDSDAVRRALASSRLSALPYRLWRPLVHGLHWVQIWRALGRPEGVIVVRPFTTGWLRRAVLCRARRHHREVHLVVVEATPAQARAGQVARGRVVRERAMRRHERGWADAPVEGEGWTTIRRLTRGEAAAVSHEEAAASDPPLPSAERSEAVADAAHRLERLGAVAELAAQRGDDDVDDVGAAGPVGAPHLLQQRRARHRCA